MLNVLTDDIIRFSAGGEVRLASLPETYVALMRDEVDSFPALRPHQRHAWHAFTVQLGAMALHRAGLDEPPTDAETWREIIRGLTPDFPDDEPWSLVVDDITKPAFMQPPASSAEKIEDYAVRRRPLARKRPVSSEEKVSDYKNVAETPDELDMLVTSRNHDLKSSVADSGGSGDWLFALVSLQTFEGYPGKKYYGISRMNSGAGNRPAFSLTPSTRHGAHARRDIMALLEYRDRLLDDYPMRDDGVCVVWTRAWDGAKSEALALDELDPFFIEICRRIRLRTSSGGASYAIRATSEYRRIEAEAVNGVVGDPWTPINAKENKSLTISAGGFTYESTVSYLTSADWQWPPLLNLTAAEKRSPRTMQLVARATVRGRGKTEGYYERIIPLNHKVIRAFGISAEMEKLGEIALSRVEQVAKVQGALKDALAEFVHQGKDIYQLKPRERQKLRNRKDVGLWVNRLGEIVDVRFFEDLQFEFDADDADERERIRSEWLLNDPDGNGLINHASQTLSTAMEELPCPMMQRYRAQVNASRVFRYGLRKSDLPIPSAGEETTNEEKIECPDSEPTQTTSPENAQVRLM